jgi:hypothetical protein
MGAPSKRAKKVRAASEFDLLRLSAFLKPPKTAPSAHAWSLEEIKAARDDQMRGHFRRPARLSESMRTDDALFVAKTNRLAPQRCLEVAMVPASGSRGKSIANESEGQFGKDGCAVTPETLANVHDCLVDHAVAFATNSLTLRNDGSRLDASVRYWPIEHVRWDAYKCAYVTQIDGGPEETIVHGDGRWIVFARSEYEPFKYGALLAAALVWARHAFAIRDWAKGSVAHGNAKVVGEMPAGVALQDSAGNVSSEAAAFLSLLQALVSADAPCGIRPAGSKTDFLASGSTAWQIFEQLVGNGEKAAARIYLGTDGTLGTNGGAPGVDIEELFGVATTIVEGDLECIERGLKTGAIDPWCAANFGDSSLAPTRRYKRPDADSEALGASIETRRKAFYADIESARSNGFVVDQKFVDSVAAKYGIEPPSLPVESAKAPSIALAPTDIARVVSVNEARASAGLGPLLDVRGGVDPDGRLTVEEYASKKKAEAEVPKPATSAAERGLKRTGT